VVLILFVVSLILNC